MHWSVHLIPFTVEPGRLCVLAAKRVWVVRRGAAQMGAALKSVSKVRAGIPASSATAKFFSILAGQFGRLLALPLFFAMVMIASSIATPASAACTLPQTLTFTSLNQTLVLDINACGSKPGVGYLGLHEQGEDVNNYYGLGWAKAGNVAEDTSYSSNGVTYKFRGRHPTGDQSDGTLDVTLVSIDSGSLGARTITTYTCDWDGASSCPAQDVVTINVNLNIPPITAAYTHAAQPYRDVAGGSINFSLAGSVSGGPPTSYAVGSSTTTGGGTVSIDNAGQVTYTQPVGYRGSDTFTYTAANAYGTSSPSTVTVPINNPVFVATPPSATGNVGVAYNPGGTPVAMSGGRPPYGAFSASGLPTGLSINSAGVISGTPTAIGTYNATITATDSSTGTGPYTGSAAITITISNTPPPVANSFMYGSTIAYNPGGAIPTSIDVSFQVTGDPTNYAVGSATTANGGSVSINSAGLASYTPPVGYRDANDSFTYTASNAGGSSSPATVTVTIQNPTFAVALPSATATVGAAYNPGSTPVTIEGGRAAYTINSISGLPPGLSQSGNAIVGTPTTQGSYTLTFDITDSSIGAGPYTSTAQAALNVVLPPPPVASSFTASAVAYNAGGASASTFSLASNTTNNPTSYAVGSATTAQGGSVSVDSTGLVSYTPAVGFRGNDSFTFTATNQGGTSSAATVTVPVSNPTFSVVLPASTGTVGVAYNSGGAAVSVSGGQAPYSNFSATGLPAGLTISNTGVISGTPTTATNATVVITLTDSSTGPYTGTASASLSIAPPTITLSPASLPDGASGIAYNETVTSTGGVAPVTYVVSSGSTPPGLTLATGGQISGTPTAAGTFNFTVTGQDSSGNAYTGSQAYTVTIAAPSISLAPASVAPATVGAAYSQTLTASGGNAPYSFQITSGALPAGLALTGGVISGTPTAGGAFNFDVTVTDATTGAGAPFTSTVSYSLTVASPTLALSPVGSLPAASIGSAYSQTITASGGTAGYIFAVTGGELPDGLTLSSGGVVSGTPTEGGVFSVTVTATDSSTGTGPYTASETYSLTVGAPSVTLSPASLPAATVAAAYSQTLTASGGTPGYTYAIASGALPDGLTLSTGGVITGVATAGGVFAFEVRATDSSTGAGAPYTGVQAYSLTVNAPTITPAPASLANGTVAAAYAQTITATGGTAPYSFAVTSGSLPAGLDLDASGALSGAPTAAGTFNFSITATDSSTGAGPYAGATAYTLTIAAPTLSVSPASLANGAVGVAYSQSINASGGVAPYSFAVTSGTLPAGLTLQADGALSGTPTAAGAFNFTVTATDSATGSGAPFTADRAFSLTIASPTISMAPASLAAATTGVAYSQTLTASGGTTPYSFAIVSGSLPAGMTLQPDGELAGTPTAAGTFNITVRATDSTTGTGAPFSTQTAYSLTVSAPSLSLSPPAQLTAAYGVNYQQAFTTTGGVAPYTYVLTGDLPDGVTFSATTGAFSGEPTEVGDFPLSVTVTDSSTGTGPFSESANVILSVTQAPPPVAEPVETETPAGQSTVIDVSDMIDGFYDDVIIVTPPQHGTAIVQRSAGRMRSQGGGTIQIVYTPNPGYFGDDVFTYAATGPGGTSAPAQISIAVAAPAPVAADDTATTSANTAVSVPVTTNDTGPLDSIAIVTPPTNGTATVSGLTVNYAPAQNFFGTDTFTYTATGEGGTSAAATVTVTVSPLAPPAQGPQTLAVVAGRPATLQATQGAAGGPFTGVTVSTAPGSGTATVSGETIVYTPSAGFSGGDTFAYQISNAFGTSAPIPVTVTVNPAPLTAPPITVEILAGQQAVVNLVQGASGGPFTGAAVVAINPAGAGTATIAAPSAGAYTLTFTPDNAFAGTAVVSYTLSNAYATSAPGRINVIVTARPDPSQDQEVRGLVAAQDAAALRFADAQISNFNRRLEQLHNGGGAGRGFGVSVRGGDPERPDGMEARERFRKYASLGVNDAADPSSLMLPAANQPGYQAEADGPDGQAGPKRWGVWAAGSADFGMRDAVGQQSGFRFTTDGLTGGVDYRVNEDFAFGVGLGYGRDSSRIGKSGTKSRAESYSAGLYASLQPGGNTFVDGILGYGTLDFDTRRYVTTTGELVNGQRDGDQVFAALTFGFERRKPTSLLSPYGRLAFSRSQLDAFSEEGGGPYGLTYHSQTVRSLTGTLGLRGEFSRRISAGLLSPRFRVEYSHDFEDTGDARLSYTDWVGGPIYRLTVDPIDRNQLRMELGADLTIRSGLRFGLDFDNMVTKDSDSQGVRLSVQTPF